jgi:hypothetical protein
LKLPADLSTLVFLNFKCYQGGMDVWGPVTPSPEQQKEKEKERATPDAARRKSDHDPAKEHHDHLSPRDARKEKEKSPPVERPSSKSPPVQRPSDSNKANSKITDSDSDDKPPTFLPPRLDDGLLEVVALTGPPAALVLRFHSLQSMVLFDRRDA